MPQVSKRIISKDIESRMFETLWEAIATVKSTKEVQTFLNDLLSPTEKTMMAKRLAIAALLLKGFSYESIKDLLKVSNETIAKVAVTLNVNTGYKLVVGKIAKSETLREFWQQIERIDVRMTNRNDYVTPDDYLKIKLKHQRKTLV